MTTGGAVAPLVVVALVVALLSSSSMPLVANAEERQTTTPSPSPPPPPPVPSLSPLVAQTPPMGWNSWNTFGCDIDEGIVRAQADAMASSSNVTEAGRSLLDLGYLYVNLDDCWMSGSRNPTTGELEADPERFPSGIEALAAYVHSLGLKLGIYSSPGPQTCAGRAYYYSSLGGLLPSVFPSFPGSENHEAQDAATFARWGVDYLKYDRCTSPAGEEAERRFAAMRDALDAAARPVVYSINPDENAREDVKRSWVDYANLWRTTKDVDPTWRWMPWTQGFWSTGVVDAIDVNRPLHGDAGPGHWNDPDMLQVGVEKAYLFGKKRLLLTDVEGRSQFSMWAMMSAPLILGNDLTRMSEAGARATAETVTNDEVIAVDQDPLGIQGRRISRPGDDAEVWAKPLVDGSYAVALFNRGELARVVEVRWSDVFVGLSPSSRVRARDLWARADVGEFRVDGGSYSAEVQGHGVVVLRAAVVQ